MNVADYYGILGLSRGSSIEEIKKSYRKIAREYHPDVNHKPGAEDIFIAATEAYEFLITNFNRLNSLDYDAGITMEEWRKYRSEQARRRANAYAHSSYSKFRHTDLYKTTRILDRTTIITSFVISIVVIFIAIYGYIYRLKHPIFGIKQPSFMILVLFVILGIIMLIISFTQLKIYREKSKKINFNDKENNQSL